MVINEKGLIRAMKDSYKQDGYTVAMSNEGWILVAGCGWIVEIEAKNFPRKALGLIAEQLGLIPAAGQAFTARKGESQTDIVEMGESEIRMLDEYAMSGEILGVQKTRIKINGYSVWQTPDKKVLCVDPEKEDILLIGKAKASEVCGYLFLEGVASRGYIRKNDGWSEADADIAALETHKWA